MDIKKIVRRAARHYGLYEMPNGDFESTRCTYPRADVLKACSVENERDRDNRMLELKQKGRRKSDAQGMVDLSMDAKVLMTSWFGYGEKTSVVIGGKGAQSVLSDRAKAAMKELVDRGYVVAREFNSFGRVEYVGTEKCFRLSFREVEKHGYWSPTKSNHDDARPFKRNSHSQKFEA